MSDNIIPISGKPQKPSHLSAAGTTISLCDLPSATRNEGLSELGACLILVSPSGLTAADRKEWIAAAMLTLSGIPSDLLERGCKKARETARFPSEIVPIVMAEIKGEWERRKRARADKDAREVNRNAPRLVSPPTVDPSEMQKLIREISGKLSA